MPAALTLLFVLGWTLTASPGLWTLAVLGISLIPSLLTALLNGLQKPGDVRWRDHLAAALRTAIRQLAQALFTVACLPYEGYFGLDAMIRTLWRMRVSHRRLLEWTSSGDLDRAPRDILAFHRRMWIAPVLALVTGSACWRGSTRPC